MNVTQLTHNAYCLLRAMANGWLSQEQGVPALKTTNQALQEMGYKLCLIKPLGVVAHRVN